MEFDLKSWLTAVLAEDVRDGDHTSLACVDAGSRQRAKLLAKDSGVIAGLGVAADILSIEAPGAVVTLLKKDGDTVEPGDICLELEANALDILRLERTILNVMQRMSGIATLTRSVVNLVSHTSCTILDTRKTTPGFRYFEKEAVRLGGGANHRFGLYDMVMIKDNHVDYSGGILQALDRVRSYLSENAKDLKVEIEVRNEEELSQVLKHGGADRVMLDNFSPSRLAMAIRTIGGKMETEASGGITIDNIVPYAETGVDFISVGALTHSAGILDLSLKAVND